jgi:putative membrane protein
MLWIKSLHIIALITWFAGLFYLPRLFVYHAMTTDSIGNERFKIMERKLYRGIMMPGMIMTIIFGAWLLLRYDRMYLNMYWLHIKLILVATLLIFHFYCGHIITVFKNDSNTHSHKFYRWLNEYPTVVLIAVVILTVVKPF